MIKEQNIKKEWDLSSLLKSDNDPNKEKELELAKEKSYEFINKWKDRTDYLESPEILKEALDEYEEWNSKYGLSGKSGYYFALRSSLDSGNKKIKAIKNKIHEQEVKINNDIDFFTHRIAKIDKEDQKKFLDSPQLTEYRHFLKGLFDDAKYLLEENEEKIVTLLSKTSYSNWVSMISDFISKEEDTILNKDGKKETKTFEEILNLASHRNKKVRDTAAKSLNSIFEKYKESAENELNSILHFKKTMDELRNMERPDLGRHLSDDIDSEIVDTLLDTVKIRHNLSHDYYELKAKLLGQKKLEYHERNITYGNIDKAYSIEKTINIVNDSFVKLDPEFSSIFESFLENGQLDFMPKKGKRGGAFCIMHLPTLPTYVFLNFTENVSDIKTIAHEMGHAINNVYVTKNQNALNAGTPLSTAEVASTFMEDFAIIELLKDADDELKLSIMMQKLNSDISTIHRQLACYRFEQDLHKDYREKGYLSYKDIGELFKTHMSSYMGPYVEQSEGSENWWVYWSHIRRFFYVYSYSSGLLISKAMQNKVKNNPDFIKNVKDFLSAGMSKSPKDIFLDMGIDISKQKFWNEGLDEIEDLLKETKALAKKLGKI